MARKLVDIFDDDGLIRSPACPADTLLFEYPCAGGWALEWTQHQGILVEEVVAHPPPPEFCFQYCHQITQI